MPASIISAETGCSAKVMGNNIAIVAVGPKPGSTPIAVPRNTPTRQYNTLIPDAAVDMPRARFEKNSIVVKSSSAKPWADHRQRNTQTLDKNQHAKNSHPDGHYQSRS